MLVWEILLLAVALSMDACAVAMTNGMTDAKMPAKKALLIGVFLASFSSLCPSSGILSRALSPMRFWILSKKSLLGSLLFSLPF